MNNTLFLLVMKFWHFINSKAATQRGSVKKLFLEILQNSQENTCARDSVLIKL